MAHQIVTLDDLQEFRHLLLEDIKQLLTTVNSTDHRRWLRSAEVREILNISPGTLQNFRVNRVLPFRKVGRIHYYKYEDIEKLFEA